MTTSLRPEHNETIRYRALRLLEHDPHLSQRQLARELGISVGKVNFLLKALADKGFVKFANFQHGDAKLKKLAYLLTPEGLQHRLAITQAYLERKTKEYHALHAELASLRAELKHTELASLRAEVGETGPLPSPRAGEDPGGRGAWNDP